MKELDEATIRRAAGRNDAAFTKLYEHYSDFVWKVVFRTVNGDEYEARQIMQDVFLKAYFSLKSYRFDSALSTWLYRIAYTTTLNHLRSKKGWFRRFKGLDREQSSGSEDMRVEQRDMVSRVLSRLRPEERFLLVAREVDGVSFEELSALTGKNPGALRTQLLRLKETVRKDYDHE